MEEVISKEQHIIVAPHADDEIIGCYEIIVQKKVNPIIIYTDRGLNDERRKEALSLKKYVDIKAQYFNYSIPTHLLVPGCILYFPDPYFEFHPDHRQIGGIGEALARSGFEVIFYSINMQAPFIRQSNYSIDKENLLNKVYPSQKDLWKYDKKYILFEGYCKWIF